MSIRSKLFLAFSVVLALAVTVAVNGIHAISNAEGLVVRLYDKPFMAVSYARSAQVRFGDARRYFEHSLSSIDSTPESNSAVFSAAMKDVAENLTIVAERLNGAGYAERAGDARRLSQDWHLMVLKIMKAPAGGLTGIPFQRDLENQADVIATAIDRVAEDASEYGFKFRAQAKAEVAASEANLITLATATVAVGILFSVGIVISFGRAIRNAVAISERVATGNLAEDIATTRKDELGRLVISLGKMQQALRTQAQDQRLAANSKDHEYAIQIAQRQCTDRQIVDFRSSVGQLLNNAYEMTEQLNLTATTLSMISAEANIQSKDAASAVEKTSSNIATIASSTDQLDTSIQAISSRLTAATRVVGSAAEMAATTEKMVIRLSNSTARIDDIVAFISSLAKQTNLLALNATIEAARAGDAGRGFTVVASEVKGLAAQTAKATEEIGGQISEVQSSTNHAVEIIKSIVRVMTEIACTTTEVTKAVQQQEIATKEISRNIQGVANATQNVSRSVEGATSSISDTNRAAAEVLETAANMTSHTKNLRDSVDRFLQNVTAI